MTTYRAPVEDMQFVMKHLADLDGTVAKLPGYEEITSDMARTVLEQAAHFNESVIAPLNQVGDQNPSWLKDGAVTTTPGFKDAFKQYAEAGWQGLGHPVALGGQGLPYLISAACLEMLNAANLSFALCPLLTDGTIEALLVAGSEEQQKKYVPGLIAGTLTGTMNLTEPQAGSDLTLVRTQATKQADGSYRVVGTKMFITYGDHDLSENIIHLVLGRVPGAPEGVKGISLFIVPKLLDDGTRNDVQCVSIEHKLGIKASPTALLEFGEKDGAVGYLVGQENRGLEYMFVMMNAARYAVGIQGIALAERAYQKAVTYARDRIQSRPVDGSIKQAAPIIHLPDVRRMLMTMRAHVEACRAMALYGASLKDLAHHHPDEQARKEAQFGYEFLVPLIKGFSTEMAVDVTSLGVQVHGGMGYVEETGAAQFFRDARILPIYEGTTAIQANDLVGRKVGRDAGATAKAMAAQIAQTEKALLAQGGEAAKVMAKKLEAARQAFLDVLGFVVANTRSNPNAVFAGSVPFLMQSGQLFAGWQMGRALLAAEKLLAAGEQVDFARAKVATARFYADHVLSQAQAWRERILEGGASVTALPVELF